MKIGLVCMHYTAKKGGLEKYTMALSEAMAARGHEVHVFASSGEKRPGIHFHHVPMFPLSSPAKNLSFAIMASKCAAGFGLDVLQSMERIWNQDIYRASDSINPIQIQEKYPNAFVRAFKTAGPRRQALTLLERRIFQKRGARFIIALSNLVKTQIMTYYQVPEEKIVVIYNSVDTNRFNPSAASAFRTEIREQFAVEKDELLILFSGNDFKRKGLPLLLEALAKLKEEKVKLLIAGSGPPERYVRFATRNGIGNKVRFIGYHNYPERLYASSDLFVLPTRDDTFGNVCLEAMACGVPTIATHTAGASEVIEHGKCGYVLNSWEAGELSARIKGFLNRKDSAVMGTNAALKASTFTMDRHMMNLFLLYESVCEEKSRACQR